MEPLPDPVVWRRTREVFDAVVSLEPAARAARLDALCRDAPDVRREVESLLAHAGVSDAAFASVVSSAARYAAGDEASLQEGQALLHYVLQAPIGEGSMGAVWRATDQTLGRAVAIKVLPARVAGDEARVRRFEQEAKTLASLNHPNIAAIHSVHHADGVRFLAMEYVDGDDLTVPIVGGPMAVAQVLTIASQIAAGLEDAHRTGIVHRDLKPANVKIRRDGTVKVLDFGLAKAFTGSAEADVETDAGDAEAVPATMSPATTRVGAILGTAAYMPPEQARGRPVDTRADIWAFGVMVFEMLTGQRPFLGATVTDVLSAVVSTEPDWSLLPDTTPPPLVALLQRCLVKDVRKRLPRIGDARLVLEDLRRLQVSPAGKTGAVRRRSSLLAAAAALLATVATGAWLWSSTRVAPVEAGRPLVAVGAFRNRSPDATGEIAAGMSQEIRAHLSQLSELRVLSRGAVSTSGTEDLQRLAGELGVGALVDGSVEVTGDQVRVSARLVDTATQQTRWSDTYARPLADVFAVQSDIAREVARALGTPLSPDEQQRIGRPPTQDLEAYRLFLRWTQAPGKGRDEWATNLGLLRAAVARDPGFVTAQANLAYSLVFRSPFYDEGAAYLAEGMAEADAVLKKDASVALAHNALATGHAIKGVASQARLSFQRALALDPNDTVAMNNLSFLETFFGRFVDGLDVARRSFEVSGKVGNDYFHLSAPLISLRDDALSRRWLAEAERRAPYDHRVQQQLALVDVLAGRDADATARLARAAAREPDDIEVNQTRSEVAFLLDSAEQEALVAPLIETSAGTVGVWLAETPRVRYAYALATRGDTARASRLIDDAERAARARIDGGDETPSWRVELAAIHALKRERQASLEALARAYDAGYREYGYLERDPIFAPLRTEERFRTLLDRMRRDVETQRQTARERGLLEIDALLAPAR